MFPKTALVVQLSDKTLSSVAICRKALTEFVAPSVNTSYFCPLLQSAMHLSVLQP